MNRILIYVHYHTYGHISSHVLHTIKLMRGKFSRIIFVSNSSAKTEDKEKLNSLIEEVINRETIGSDFDAWKDAIIQEGWDSLSRYDSVTLMNDTCLGPLFDIEPVYKRMEEREADFWGITNHKKTRAGFLKKKRIPEHLQYNFLCFTRKVVSSKIFKEFWVNIKYCINVSKPIYNYEIQLTRILKKNNIKYISYIDTVGTYYSNHNQAHCHPEIMLKEGNPFIKIESFFYNDNPGYLLDKIREETEYPTELIEEHLTKYFIPNISYKITNKNLVLSESTNTKINANNFKVALHIHVFYIDVFIKYVKALTKNNFIPDIFVSTNSNEKMQEILSEVKKHGLTNALQEIAICKNRGRDVAPWLLEFKKINNYYDIVGHFHTKKSAWQEGWIGTSWQNEIIDTLITPLESIINIFHNNDIGLVIADIPNYFKRYVSSSDWAQNKNIFISLWKKMGLNKHIDVNTIVTPIMPYGNMYWYRSAALKPLFDMKLSIDDFPQEPIPNDGTLAHAIERLPVYIAWDQDYDFRIALHEKYVDSFFVCKENILTNRYGIIESKTLRRFISVINIFGRCIYLFDKALYLFKTRGYKALIKRAIMFLKMSYYEK